MAGRADRSQWCGNAVCPFPDRGPCALRNVMQHPTQGGPDERQSLRRMLGPKCKIIDEVDRDFPQFKPTQ